MLNKVIIPTGFMGSGSSAITDLLSEYNTINVSNGDNEFVFMHCPNGLFDLEDKLLIGNNSLRSDEAIHTFLNTMYNLYINNGHWISNYKSKISVDFYKYCEDLIADLSPYTFENVYWYYQQNPINIRMNIELYILRIIRKITHSKDLLFRPLSYRQTNFVYPTDEEFYNAANKFLSKIYSDLGLDDSNIVIDQLVLPHNLNRIDNYFDEKIRVIVVDRDPRDVFLSNKYIWYPMKQMVPFPLEAEKFCSMYKKIRSFPTNTDSRILYVHFEDFIYKYYETIDRIESFIGIRKEDHINKFKHFDPQKSIFNTQLFKREEYKDDGIVFIEENLNEYLYSFCDNIPENIRGLKPF